MADWTREEIVLVCAELAANEWHVAGPHSAEVLTLSELLNRAAFIPQSEREDNFRNPNSIRRKMYDLATLLPNYDGVPTKGGATTRAVLEQFLADPAAMKAEASRIRNSIGEGGSGFNVDRLHEYLAVIPAGRWTTYGVVSGLAGTGPRGLGSHIRTCTECANAWRVLEEAGQPSPSFVWSDPAESRTPQEILESEGVRFSGLRADPGAFIDADELRRLRAHAFRWPTIEWVKIPVDLATGEPNGQPISMRHFTDCDHWYRNDAGDFVGDPPFLASDEQMHDLAACKDCQYRAEKSANSPFGPRPSTAPIAPMALTVEPGVPTDVVGKAVRRYEQSYLRAALLRGRSTAPCDVCGRVLPAALLVAAHIVPRAKLSEAERYDFHARAMLACLLGCDALFERGLIQVHDDGHIAVCSFDVDPSYLAQYENSVAPGFSDERKESFARHREIHSEPAH